MKHGIVIPFNSETFKLNIKTYLMFTYERPNIHLCFMINRDEDRYELRKELAKFQHYDDDNIYVLNKPCSSMKESLCNGMNFLLRMGVDTIGYINAAKSTSFKTYWKKLKSEESYHIKRQYTGDTLLGVFVRKSKELMHTAKHLCHTLVLGRERLFNSQLITIKENSFNVNLNFKFNTASKLKSKLKISMPDQVPEKTGMILAANQL